MANDRAGNFYDELKAAVCRWPVDEFTDRVMLKKLSRWKLTQAQWNKALDDLCEKVTDGKLPPPAIIFEALKVAQISTEDTRNLGWLMFDLNGRRKAMRIKSVNGRWMQLCTRQVADEKYAGGFRTEFTGEVKEIRTPEGATNGRYCPDHPAPEDLEDHREDLRKLTETVLQPLPE